MNQPNLQARGFQNQSEMIASYSRAFEDITLSEQHRINEFILELLTKLKARNPNYYRYLISWLNKIVFAKSIHWLESGMPHTISNIVIMNEGWFKNPNETILLHELTHIHQRMVPFEFEELYNQLGYIPYNVPTIRGIEPVLVLNRNNPDGMSPNWLWKKGMNTWWIGAVFKTATPQNLSDIDLIALKLDMDASGNYYYLKQNPTLLDFLPEFSNFFGNNPNNYHPNEMSAKFAEWYIEDILGHIGIKHDKYKGYTIYKKYFDNLIGTYY
jgi:hypothetical protein